jgi:hypothetical protein
LIDLYVGRDTILSVDGIHTERHNPFATLLLTLTHFIFDVIIAIIKVLGTSWTEYTNLKGPADSFKGVVVPLTQRMV